VSKKLKLSGFGNHAWYRVTALVLMAAGFTICELLLR
jgi:hypothetical protein